MIYLDYAAATPMDPRVLKAMHPFLTDDFGNASSIHRYGQTARRAVDEAREYFVKVLGAQSPHNIIFTGSGTESCNMAIFGAAFARQDHGRHIVISALEHPAVLEAAERLRDFFGFELTLVKPDSEGLIHPEAVKAALRKDTILVSVIYANNEIGTIQPIKKIAKIIQEHNRKLNRDQAQASSNAATGVHSGALFHTDACQTPGFLDINASHLGVDLLSLNGSKIYGPKGVGLLYVREGVKITPLVFGGGQEFRMRGGTENVAGIVGFAEAMRLTLKDSKKEASRLQKLRDQLLNELLKIKRPKGFEFKLNGSRSARIPNNINVHTPGLLGETLVQRLDMEGLSTSSGAACSSGKTEPSHVLLALGQSKKKASESLRLTLGRGSTLAQIQTAKKLLRKAMNVSAT